MEKLEQPTSVTWAEIGKVWLKTAARKYYRTR